MNAQLSIDRGLLLLRVAIGSVFVAHGLQKIIVFGYTGLAGFLGSIGIPFPGVNAILLIAVEFVGGLALLAGGFTRLAALLVAGAMAVAVFTVHLTNGYFLPDGIEYTSTLMLASLSLALTGAGRYSLDAKLRYDRYDRYDGYVRYEEPASQSASSSAGRGELRSRKSA